VTLLNTADKIYLGAQTADAVYLGAELVWSSAPVVIGSYVDEVMADSPLGYWRFGEPGPWVYGMPAVDASGRRDGTYTSDPTLGVPSTLTSDANTAMQVAGANQQGVQIPNHADYQISTLTLEAWVKTTGAGSSFRSIAVKQDAYGIFAIDGVLGTYVWGTATVVNTGVTIADGDPHHIVMVLRDGVAAGSQFYLDGVPVGTAFTYVTSNHAQPLDFGYNSFGGQEFIGVIDEGAIYGTALSAGRIAAHYAAGVAPSPPSFVPSDLTGLTVWLDASQLGLADGAEVEPWPNLGSGPDAANYNVSPYRPTLRANALNGLPVVRFIPGAGLRGGYALGGGTLGPYNLTLVYVARMVGPGIGRIFTATYPGANYLVGFHTSAFECMYDNGWVSAGVGWPVLPTPWKMYGSDGSHDGTNYLTRFLINGVVTASATNGSGMGTLGWNLSGYAQAGGEETCDCEVAEVLLYDRKLSDAERLQAEEYLRDKWGLT
jgi:hypothetical protein